MAIKTLAALTKQVSEYKHLLGQLHEMREELSKRIEALKAEHAAAVGNLPDQVLKLFDSITEFAAGNREQMDGKTLITDAGLIRCRTTTPITEWLDGWNEVQLLDRVEKDLHLSSRLASFLDANEFRRVPLARLITLRPSVSKQAINLNAKSMGDGDLRRVGLRRGQPVETWSIE